MKKPWSSILIQFNVEWWNWKKNSIIQKDSKYKITIKRMRIKIEIQNKFYFLLNGEIGVWKRGFNRVSKKIEYFSFFCLKLFF